MRQASFHSRTTERHGSREAEEVLMETSIARRRYKVGLEKIISEETEKALEYMNSSETLAAMGMSEKQKDLYAGRRATVGVRNRIQEALYDCETTPAFREQIEAIIAAAQEAGGELDDDYSGKFFAYLERYFE